ncbi:hypothetical protein [Miniphocaeibacter halophilus]|uniref:Uncharacterized protein n=1 Tax=Miniphocaeibacter halophilus TaxID=2931922 RepID=A0AC61MSC2_9FIRM|nr:hypothetical protein [Miniphocaeibacter halophilus]QQK08357.1 hypothetical protein JFY71_02095 [Miniphocaeibacter halophilus]
MKKTIDEILEQLKIIIFIYIVVFTLHILFGSKDFSTIDLIKATLLSFAMVILAVTIKNFVKKPNLPGFAWATLVAFFLTLPVSPVQSFVVNTMKPYIFSLVVLPLLGFAGISVGDQLDVLKKLSWKIVLISFVVMASTYFGSALISNIVLSMQGLTN